MVLEISPYHVTILYQKATLLKEVFATIVGMLYKSILVARHNRSLMYFTCD